MKGFRYILQYYNHQGSVSVVTNMLGHVHQHLQYLPYGGIFVDVRGASVARRQPAPSPNNPDLCDDFWSPYTFSAKEKDAESGYNYFGARYYTDNIMMWLSVDPMSDKYPSTSPYMYCLGNPIMYVDEIGKDVKPAGDNELEMIRNTLPKDARNYVQLDENGFIDRALLNSYEGDSYNVNCLKTLVNSEMVVDVILDDKFTYKGQDGTLGTATMSYTPYDPLFPEDKDLSYVSNVSTGETGFTGKTLFPDLDGLQNSPDRNIKVIINKNLSSKGAAETYSHEANGHAFLYLLNGYDHNGASHIFSGSTDTNKPLVESIIRSRNETILNMKE